MNFAFVPRHLRIPYVAAVSFGWTVILSVSALRLRLLLLQDTCSAACRYVRRAWAAYAMHVLSLAMSLTAAAPLAGS